MRGKIILHTDSQRNYAKQKIDEATEKSVVTIAEPTRTNEQNAKLWAMLSDISKQCLLPSGNKGVQDTWKCLAMRSCKMECRYELDFDNQLFPIGYRSSELPIKECSELIEWLYAFGAEQNVVWKETERMAA